MSSGIIRGALFRHVARQGEDPNKRHPVYDIQLEVLGVKLRLAAWPQVDSKSGAVKYLPISGDYAQSEARRLVDVLPTMGTVQAAKVDGGMDAAKVDGGMDAAAQDGDAADLPF